MFIDKKILAIIPARSGSKGLKDKNIKLLNKKPMLTYSIESALQSNVIDEIYVSTDSVEYADIARKYGANVPFLRSTNNATDTAGTFDVVREALLNYKEIGKKFDWCIILQPTSPLRSCEDIISSLNLMWNKEAVSVVGVCECEHSPLWSNILSENQCLKGFLREDLASQRQLLNTYYRINGAMYIVDVKYILENDNMYTDKSFAYVMPKERSVDIDDIYDFCVAEAFLKMERE
ncbi:MAG: CMP-N-acetlyneuraminic acid synthetase [Epulopiscium sp. Nele67-Bin005]|nr:MAG: CMP-N-acetlyneuraminic acid synthetase [Epulopiscium sp. Nele67-Bin005]